MSAIKKRLTDLEVRDRIERDMISDAKFGYGLSIDLQHGPLTIADEAEVSLGEVPTRPVHKMAKGAHVDNFFEKGALRLGSFEYYNDFDHEEIGDPLEGSHMVVGRNDHCTMVFDQGSGYEYFILCCFLGAPDEKCLDNFGYDASFRITDVEGFASAVGKNIGADTWTHAECTYSRLNAMTYELDPNVHPERGLRIGTGGVFMGGERKYFVKPNQYANQCEFRFIWKTSGHRSCPRDIRCREAVQHCERTDSASAAGSAKRSFLNSISSGSPRRPLEELHSRGLRVLVGEGKLQLKCLSTRDVARAAKRPATDKEVFDLLLPHVDWMRSDQALQRRTRDLHGKGFGLSISHFEQKAKSSLGDRQAGRWALEPVNLEKPSATEDEEKPLRYVVAEPGSLSVRA